MDFISKLRENKVIPVAVFDNSSDASRAAELLLKYNFKLLEITMRTQNAAECIRTLSNEFPELTVGAGSIDSPKVLQLAVDSGASFAVSAGLDAETISSAANMGIPFVPGAATPTELMTALKYVSIIKIFPASLLGGVDYINAICAPFAMKDLHLIPTGGIDETNFMNYLSAEKVIACGMSRITDKKLIAAADYTTLGKLIHDVAMRLADLPEK